MARPFLYKCITRRLHIQAEQNIRVRFAPSPTGPIHLGGLRMALYNYIFARKNKGSFILRIEDTDQSRSVEGSADNIEEILDWASLKPDESPRVGGAYGPYLQSKRLDLYQKYTSQLLDTGKAYRCYCSPMRLELLRRHQAKNRLPIGYDNNCRHLSKAEIEEKKFETGGKYTVRLCLEKRDWTFNDMIYGTITNNGHKSDPIILKSDSYPTYHLANVVDDKNMAISHVLRGCEWISSTFIHLQLYESLNWTPPIFYHFPLITTTGGAKMSKRKKESTVQSWIDLGYDPKVLLNFLTSIGGGIPKDKQDNHEVWTLDKIVEKFDFDKVSNHPGSVDVDRLDRYSRNELTETLIKDPDMLVRRTRNFLTHNRVDCQLSDTEIHEVLKILIPRIFALSEILNDDYLFIWSKPKLSWSKEYYINMSWNLVTVVDSLKELIEEADLNDKDNLILRLKEYSEENQLKYSEVMKFIRKAITNKDKGLKIYELLEVLRKERFLEYLENVRDYVTIQDESEHSA